MRLVVCSTLLFVVTHLRVICSLQSLCQQLPARREELYNSTPEGASQEKTLSCKAEVVAAVWDLLHMCDEQDDFDIREVAAEFLAVVRIFITLS